MKLLLDENLPHKLRQHLPGHDVFTITDAQLNEWKKSAEPLEKLWIDNVRKAGGNPDAIMKELKDSLAQYQAAY